MKRTVLIYIVAALPSLLLLWAAFTIVVNLINAIYAHAPTHNITPIF